VEWRAVIHILKDTASHLLPEARYSVFCFVVANILRYNCSRDFFLTHSIEFTFLILLSRLKAILKAPLNKRQINGINDERKRNIVQCSLTSEPEEQIVRQQSR
jgi:hypothetical protein